jgi:hypothetical protein
MNIKKNKSFSTKGFCLKKYFLIMAVCLSSHLHAQISFDQKVDQLFFNVDVTNTSLTVLDSLSAAKNLQYIKVDASANFYMPGTVLVTGTYLYQFDKVAAVTTPFEKGSITLLQYANAQGISEIIWELQFENKDSAIMAFNELVSFLKTPTSEAKLYKTREFIKVAEISDPQSTRSKQLLFRILNNKNEEKKFKIRLFLDE